MLDEQTDQTVSQMCAHMCCAPYITGSDPSSSASLMHAACMPHMHEAQQLVVPVLRSCQSPIRIWLVNYLHLRLHLHASHSTAKYRMLERYCTLVRLDGNR